MDALRAECAAVEVFSLPRAKGDERDHSDTDSTGATSECGYAEREGKCLYTHNCDELQLPPYVSREGLICHGDQEVIGTTRAHMGKEGTLFVWDWDDTLFPSSWINAQGMRLDDDYQVPDLQRAQLDALAANVMKTLEAAMTYGQLVIITNAEEGWVPLSCNKFTPSMKPIIDKFKSVSARTRYETAGVFSPLTWKMKCFEHEIAEYFDATGHAGFRNVISLGDSIHEREAMQRVARDMPCGSKTMKFPERPTLQDLISCHELVRKALPALAAHDGDLDLAVRLDGSAAIVTF